MLSLNASAASTSLHRVDLRIEERTRLQRFISPNFSLVSNGSATAPAHGIDVSVRAVTWNDSAILFDAGEVKRRGVVMFARKNPISSSFELVRQPVTDFDALRVKLAITTNYTAIRGFKFVWRFMNSGVDHYVSTSDTLLSGLVG